MDKEEINRRKNDLVIKIETLLQRINREQEDRRKSIMQRQMLVYAGQYKELTGDWYKRSADQGRPSERIRDDALRRL